MSARTFQPSQPTGRTYYPVCVTTNVCFISPVYIISASMGKIGVMTTTAGHSTKQNTIIYKLHLCYFPGVLEHGFLLVRRGRPYIAVVFSAVRVSLLNFKRCILGQGTDLGRVFPNVETGLGGSLDGDRPSQAIITGGCVGWRKQSIMSGCCCILNITYYTRNTIPHRTHNKSSQWLRSVSLRT